MTKALRRAYDVELSHARWRTPQDHRGHAFVMTALELGHRVAVFMSNEEAGFGAWMTPTRFSPVKGEWVKGDHIPPTVWRDAPKN